MKYPKYLLKLILILFPLIMFAQSPQGVGYQGVATDLNGVELISQTISIQANILSSSATGNLEWQEQHLVTTDTFGLFSLTIGQGISTGNGAQANFADISWGSAIHFLKIEMDFNGGTNFSHFGTNQMMSVPYALYAENANVNLDSISNSLSNDSLFTNSFGSNISIQCVDMGVSIMCAGLGLDPSASLTSTDNFSYSIGNSDDLNSSSYITDPHWRKFKINGMSNLISSGSKLMFKCKNYQSGSPSINTYPTLIFVTPEFNSGEIFFYVTATEGTNGNCVNESNIGLSIPITHSINAYNSSTWGSGNWQANYRNYFEIYFESNGSYKSTGVFFDIN
jgi:hypothetical protein